MTKSRPGVRVDDEEVALAAARECDVRQAPTVGRPGGRLTAGSDETSSANRTGRDTHEDAASDPLVGECGGSEAAPAKGAL